MSHQVNKRSESDGIVVAERPRPDKPPVRRCESTGDAASSMKQQQQPEQPYKDIKTVASATIVKGPEDANHSIGDTVHFRAHYFGNPEPRVVWIKNGSRIGAKDERVSVQTYSGESTLIVADLRGDDSGKYEILIENEVGSDAAAASLGVEGPPEPPAGRPYVGALEPGATSTLTLAWYGSTFDGGSAVTGYVVEMSSWPVDAPAEATGWAVLGGHSHHSTSYVVKGKTFSFSRIHH